MFRHATSLAHVLNVCSVPLKPSAALITSDKHRLALSDGHDNLNSMLPDGIMKINIGSNLGLALILRQHFEDENQHLLPPQSTQYTAFNVDCNIFDRCLKVDDVVSR